MSKELNINWKVFTDRLNKGFESMRILMPIINGESKELSDKLIKKAKVNGR